MTEILLKLAPVLEETCDLMVVSHFQEVKQLSGTAALVGKAFDGLLADAMRRDGFEGKFGEWLVLPTFGKLKARKVAVIGLGERGAFTPDAVRRLGAIIIRKARDAKAKKVATVLPGAGAGNVTTREIAEALGEGLWLGAYRFHAYKGKLAAHEKRETASVVICETEKVKVVQAERGLAEAQALAGATMLARDLVNTPSADMTPSAMADAARSLAARGSGISVKFMSAEAMRKMGMHATLAVGRGSQHQPVGVHLTYKPSRTSKKSKLKRIAIVGKAVTFDSGGLSLKPADSMMTMKCDMAGAAAVLGLFKALPSIKPNVEVHGIFLAVENMPSGEAYRPGDVVKAMNGTTIEVLNTDAEGRVTLADALSYTASRIKPDAMIDLATLTGACVVALGEDIAALMTDDRKLGGRLLDAAKAAGEELWELPLYQPYDELIKSKIADIKNTGSRWGGAINAGMFLRHFVGETPWAHLDIAGPAYAEHESRPDISYGGTGYGVRLLARYLQGL